MNRHPLRRASPMVKMIAFSMIAGLLIWAKLRLVTDYPRTVQADPPDQEVQAEKTPAAVGVAAPPDVRGSTHFREESSPDEASD